MQDLESVSKYINTPFRGIEESTYYPDQGIGLGNCYENPQFKAVSMRKYQYESTSTVEAIKVGLYQTGPLLAVAKVGLEFMFYESGIMDVENSYFSKYHPLLIVGYGRELGVDYWIAKNSFGHLWGEAGYLRTIMVHSGVDIL